MLQCFLNIAWKVIVRASFILPYDFSNWVQTAVYISPLLFGRLCFAAATSASIVISPSTVYPNQNVSLFCVTSGNPQPSVRYWMKDGRPLRVDSHVWLHLAGVQLRIVNLQPDDAGHYTCITSAQVNGNYLKVSTFLEISSFGASVNTTYATEASNATLVCNGTNLTLVRWYRDSKLLDGLSRYMAGGVGEKLTILNVRLSDEGLYRCEGFYSSGKLYSTVFLQVVPASSHATPEQHGNSTPCLASDMYSMVACDANMTVYVSNYTNCTANTYIFEIVSYDPATEEVESVKEGYHLVLSSGSQFFSIPYPVDCTLCKVYGIEILAHETDQPALVKRYDYLQGSSLVSRSCWTSNRKRALFFSQYPLLQVKLMDVNCTCVENYNAVAAEHSINELLADILGDSLVNTSAATIKTNSARSQLVYRAPLQHLSLYQTIERVKFLWAIIRQLDTVAIGGHNCQMRFDLNCRTLYAGGITDPCTSDMNDGCSLLRQKQTADTESQSDNHIVTIAVSFGAAALVAATVGLLWIRWRHMKRKHYFRPQE